MQEKICKTCGKPFKTNNARKLYCSKLCRYLAIYKRISERRRALRTVKKVCPICEKVFKTSNSRKKFCCHKCQRIKATQDRGKRNLEKLVQNNLKNYSARKFRPIPSTNGKYEISNSGVLRNSRTKQRIKIQTPNSTYRGVTLCINGKSAARSIGQLLWEVWGILPKKIHKTPIPVKISKDGWIFNFSNLKKCSAFLADKENCSVRGVANKLYKRAQSFRGWKIKYDESSRADFSPCRPKKQRRKKDEINRFD